MNILFADDEPLVFSIFRHHLAKYNSPYIKAFYAVSGEELVKEFRRISPSVVFTDISMPGLNGLEAVDEIKKEYGECASFYVFSGYDEFEYARHALRSGVRDYLSKPISYSVFQKILENEERKYYCGITLEKAYRLNDEEKALSLSLMISGLSQAYSGSDAVRLEEYRNSWIREKTEIDGKFFFTHFGVHAETLEEQEKVIEDRIVQLGLSGRRTQSKSQQILSYIDRNCTNPSLSLDVLASEFGYSLQYLSLYIKRETRVGFSEYITRKRIEKAKEMLRKTEMTVKEIAEECGYSYSNYFIKVFSKKTGMTPQEWREETKYKPK